MSAPNRRRGEVAATIAGRRVTLLLTLGSLAELEAAFGAQDLVALAARFETGRLSTGDLLRVFAAGLSGAGQTLTEAEIEAMPVAGSLGEIVAAVAELLQATFEGAPPNPPGPRPA